MSASAKTSQRAQRFWQRLTEWYGTRLTEQYGTKPPADWCELIDQADNDAIKTALAEIRTKHVSHPPTFPEVDALFSKTRIAPAAGPSVQSRLADFVLKHRRLTRTQLRMPWTYLHSGSCGGADRDNRPSSDYAITGVVIPPDGVLPGYRVMVEDMLAEAA